MLDIRNSVANNSGCGRTLIEPIQHREALEAAKNHSSNRRPSVCGSGNSDEKFLKGGPSSLFNPSYRIGVPPMLMLKGLRCRITDKHGHFPDAQYAITEADTACEDIKVFPDEVSFI